ncbi:hypothetical protein BS47DRAFT_736514 [Hydnum rufescens UP504]|uniref:Uncharacterized protein n=1 Tax=Hydnum rufescens UP504 TaxID=1448309 RepID=A0A9P6B2K8_9AGAM|nr:hypothetical protein BS47DRAFT_736514 [Hydnum rufescens UP504]
MPNNNALKGPMDSFVRHLSKEEYDEKKSLEFNEIRMRSSLFAAENSRKQKQLILSNHAKDCERQWKCRINRVNLQIKLGVRTASGKILKSHLGSRFSVQRIGYCPSRTVMTE